MLSINETHTHIHTHTHTHTHKGVSVKDKKKGCSSVKVQPGEKITGQVFQQRKFNAGDWL